MQHRFYLASSFLILVCLAAYWRGLEGGFWFDDYGALVLNEGVRLSQFSWSGLSRGAWSYAQSGPLGRPLAMATFTFDFWWHGLSPYWAKLENLVIHLFNGILVFVLVLRMLRVATPLTSEADSGRLNYLALFVAAWWLLNPMAMTSVLYVVQRMTSLAATFSLLGLIAYLHWRIRARDTGRLVFLVAALLALTAATLASVYTKESGALTVAYAWTIEVFLFSLAATRNRFDNVLGAICLIIPLLVLGYSLFFVLANPDWLHAQNPGRDFTPWQRLLSELRILVLYMRQILFPDSSWFALYHDDIRLSLGWVTPVETLWAGLFHVVAIVGSVVLARRYPLAALGMLWFYVGHLLESTVFSLELAHEHRNYLPMLGLLLTASLILMAGFKRLEIGAGVPALLLLAAVTGVTAVRADIMGDAIGFYLHQAHNHPGSSRANYDAAMILMTEVRADRLLLEDAAPRIQSLLDLSQSSDVNALAPLLGKLTLASMRDQRSEETLRELEARLRGGVPPAAIHIIVVGLMELVRPDSPALGIGDMERLLQASLANPRLGGVSRASVQANYGMLLAGMKHDLPGAKEQLAGALAIIPNALEIRLNYVGLLLDLGEISLAREQLEIVKQRDSYANHSEGVSGLEKIILERMHGGK